MADVLRGAAFFAAPFFRALDFTGLDLTTPDLTTLDFTAPDLTTPELFAPLEGAAVLRFTPTVRVTAFFNGTGARRADVLAGAAGFVPARVFTACFAAVRVLASGRSAATLRPAVARDRAGASGQIGRAHV